MGKPPACTRKMGVRFSPCPLKKGSSMSSYLSKTIAEMSKKISELEEELEVSLGHNRQWAVAYEAKVEIVKKQAGEIEELKEELKQAKELPCSKRHWNYRIVSRQERCGENLTVQYGIHEVHYENDVPVSYVPHPEPVVTHDDSYIQTYQHTVDDLRTILNNMLSALEKPLLTEKDFEK